MSACYTALGHSSEQTISSTEAVVRHQNVRSGRTTGVRQRGTVNSRVCLNVTINVVRPTQCSALIPLNSQASLLLQKRRTLFELTYFFYLTSQPKYNLCIIVEFLSVRMSIRMSTYFRFFALHRLCMIILELDRNLTGRRTSAECCG